MKNPRTLTLRSLLAVCFLLASAAVFGQKDWTPARQEIHDNILLSASNYVAYVDPTEKLTPSPKGYEPFYLSHYGRHGSRWLISEWEYSDAIGVMERAHAQGKLTPRGEKLREQLNEFYKTTINRRGELTTVGERQHHRIGKRLTERFPEIFGARNSQVDARSTVVIRCILSMEAECEELSRYNKNIHIHNDVSESFQYYLNADWEKRVREGNDEKWSRVANYRSKYINPERFWSVIMNDANYRDEKINSRTTVMRRVFDICSNMQSHDTDINLYDLFTEEECYNLWRCTNIDWYVNYSSGISPFTQANLLKNFLATADTITDSRSYHGATLRFGHEVCVMPLAALLELDHCYPEVPMEGLDTLDRVWANFRIFPMASNIQLVFYRPKNGKGDILVKGLLNEKEVTLPGKPVSGPYYRWAELKAYYEKKLADYESVLPSPDKKRKTKTVMETFADRHSTRSFADRELTPQDLSDLLWAAQGKNRNNGNLTAPTAMNRQEIRLYVFTDKDVSLYDPQTLQLKKVADGDHRDIVASRQEFAKTAPVSLVMVADMEKFGSTEPHAMQMAYVDAGIVCENINLFCSAAGLVTVPRATMDHKAIQQLLGLTEKQFPVLNNPVGYAQ